MAKVATMPIYGKNIKKKSILLRNQMANDRETWYATFGAQVLPSLLKWWPWVDLYLFYSKVKFGPLRFVWEKGKTMDFSETIVVYDLKLARGFCWHQHFVPWGLYAPCPGAI